MTKPLLDARRHAAISKLLNDRHGPMLRDESFTISARVEGDNPVAQVVLKSRDRTLEYTMEAAFVRADYPAFSMSDALDVCVDFLDWYLGEYFREERDAFLPLDWKKFRFGDLEVMARGDLRNALLDDLADAWLRGETEEVSRQVATLRRGKARGPDA
jgi:hypothetical protein